MYIVIVGCGRIGSHLAKALMAVGHEVTVIENNLSNFQIGARDMGGVVMQGDGTSIASLEEAGVARAELIIAVTGSDESNLAVCQMAKSALKAPRTMALIKNPGHEGLFRSLGVDHVINRTRLVLSTIEEEVPDAPLVHLLNIPHHSMDLISLSIPNDSAAIDKSLAEIDMPPNSFITLVVNKNGPSLPHDDLVLSAGDDIVLVTVQDEEQILLDTFTGAQ